MNRFLKALIIVIALPLSVLVAAFVAETIALDSQATAQQSNMQQRIEDYKNKLGTAPSKTELDRVKLRCNVAQSTLKNLNSRIGTVQEKRVSGYSNINGKLTKLTEALKAKQLDTTKIDTETAALKVKTDAFEKDLEAYQQTIEDASAANCAEDPLALRAALEEARDYHTKLVASVADIRAYVSNVIKPTLKQIRADLVTQAAASTQTDTGATPDAAQ